MSQATRSRARNSVFVWEKLLTEDEKKNVTDWCQIGDQIISEAIAQGKYPQGSDIDTIIEKMTDAEFKIFMKRVIARKRKKNGEPIGEAALTEEEQYQGENEESEAVEEENEEELEKELEAEAV